MPVSADDDRRLSREAPLPSTSAVTIAEVRISSGVTSIPSSRSLSTYCATVERELFVQKRI